MKNLYSFFVGLFLFMLVGSANAQTLENDSIALVDFYNTSGGNWSSTWLVDPISSWEGVTVAEVDGVARVTEINIAGVNKEGVYPVGTISASIGNLSALTVLKLIGVEPEGEQDAIIIDLNGSIPSEIWNLTNLTRLQIKFTNITGDIPTEGIENMVNLEEINFQQSYLACEIPEEIFELPSLKKAYLHESNFIGEVPSTLSQATGLTRLYLHGNKLSGSLPYVDLPSTNEAKVQLTGNFFSIEDVKPYHDDANTTVEGSDYNKLKKLTDDYQLAQADQHISYKEGDAVEFSITVDNAWRYNWFYNSESTSIDTDNTYNIASVSSTEEGLYTCKVQTRLVTDFYVKADFYIDNVVASDVSALVSDSLALVDFYNTSGGNWSSTWLVDPISSWEGVTVAVVDGVDRVTEVNIAKVNKDGVYPSGPISSSLGSLSALSVLKLIGVEPEGDQDAIIIDLNGSIPSALWSLTNLTRLQIKFTNITGDIPIDGIANMVNLEEINFQKSYLGCEIPEEIFELPSLKKAYLHESNFTGSVPSTLSEATGLSRLYLQGNQLSGSLPYVDLPSENEAKVQLTGNYFSIADVKPYHDDANTTVEGSDYNKLKKLTDDYQLAQADQHISYTEGDAVEFTITVDNAWRYNWFYNSGSTSIDTDNTYDIASVSSTDEGLYTCKVQTRLVTDFYVKANFYIDEVSVSTDIDDPATVEYSVYPNPFANAINVKAESGIVSVALYNSTGSMVYKRKEASSYATSISTSNLSKGIYILKVDTKNGTVVEKLIKR